MSPLPFRVGVVGCGSISDTYLRNAALFAPTYRIVACADLDAAAARGTAATWGVTAMTPDGLMAADDIDVVLNLTVPAAHVAVSAAALRAGKHVYSEKPLALSTGDADLLGSLAAAHGASVAAAPDTVLGAAVQAARAAIDAGAIGEVVGAHAAVMDRGMEDWHPSPGFFFQPGGGPVLDMGPYSIAALVTLLGPVAEVVSFASIGVRERRIGSGPRAGVPIEIGVPTSVRALVRFAAGIDAVFVASWDVWRHTQPHLEIYGTEGTLTLPDPNWFGGSVLLSRRGEPPDALPLEGFAFGAANRPLGDGTVVADYRGAGLADLCRAVLDRRVPRLDLSLARHLTAVLVDVATGGGPTRLPDALAISRPAPLSAEEAATWRDATRTSPASAC